MKSSKIVKILTPITIAAAIVLIWNWQTLLWVVGGAVVLLVLAFLIVSTAFKPFDKPRVKKDRNEKQN